MAATEDELFGQIAVDRGYVTPEQLAETRDKQRVAKEKGLSKPLGLALVSDGVLSRKQVREIGDELFAKIAVERGYLTPEQLAEARDHQRSTEEAGFPQPLGLVLLGKGFLAKDQAQEVRNLVAFTTGEARLVGRYDVIAKLGQGGMGAVYLAEDSFIGRKVALKIFPPSLATPERIESLRQGLRLVVNLKHPNIATVHDAGFDDNRKAYYVALEYVEGQDLRRLIESGSTPQPVVLLRIMAALAGALQYVHEHGFIHRDLKPENIMVDLAGQPRLLDLGLARPSRGAPPKEEGEFVGSPYYVSPEHAAGEGVSSLSDIWSLGATMYHLLAGRPVYDGKTVLEILKQITSPDPVDLSPLEGKAPEYVVSIIGKCLRKNPGERYQTADELRRALEAAVDHMEMAESDTVEFAPPAPGKTVLLHVEYQEADFAGAYREYDWGERIGGGSYGDVYRAKQKLAGRDVALKILKREWLDDRDTVARFRREATLLSRLSHPNIVRVYNYGRWGASFFIEMELVDGPELAEIMAERGIMDPPDAVRYVAPVLSGLAAVHEAGAMHRDLKTENIKIMGDRVVVIDFGMARGKDLQSVTMSGAFLGTPHYAAPEQATGDATSASDVYATGVILYEMLTSKLPHEAETAYGLLQKIVSEPPVPITERRSDLPDTLLNVLDRMLAKEPEKRPSAAEARELLANIGG